MAAVMITASCARSSRPAQSASRPASRAAEATPRRRLVAVADVAPGVQPAQRASARRVSAGTFRRRRIGVVLGFVAALAVAGQAGASFGDPSAAGPERAPSVQRYVVRSGDSLWSAAARLAPSADPRAVVDALVKVRGSGPVMPGEVLRWQR